MSRFLCPRYKNLEPYVPGEQPKDREYVKLNSNETSVKPSPKVMEVLKSSRMEKLCFYGDPDAVELRQAVADKYSLDIDNIFVANGSDEVLSIIFLAFFERPEKAVFPDITYGYYHTFCKSFNIDAEEIPLNDDFTVNTDAFINSRAHILLANPNAPTGLDIPVTEIERMVSSNPDRLVIIDEAYIDFDENTDSCIPLINKYNNLIVVHTMSKSRNIAGAHIGWCAACRELIDDINGLKYAYNPYILNDMTIAAGKAAMEDDAYYEKCIKDIRVNREYLKEELKKLNFYVTDSKTNFVFAKHAVIPAEKCLKILRDNGILVRHYNLNRISDYLRITVGTRDEIDKMLQVLKSINENKISNI